jgi:hypothetical protein
VREKPSTLLNRLEKLKTIYGDGIAEAKLELMRRLERRRLTNADEVLRLHECLCFWRAYPDDARVLEQVEKMLAAFSSRSDLRRQRKELADSGIAGTPTYYSFFWPTARWLARHWPGQLSVDWSAFAARDRLAQYLPLLISYSETPALDMLDHSTRKWIELLKGADETDGSFLVHRFEALRGDSFTRETLFESFDIPFRLDAGRGTPSRTRARYGNKPVVWQTGSLSRARPNLWSEVERPPLRVRRVQPKEAEKLISLAREGMVTRSRDLEVFAQADRNDVSIADCGDGLQFVWYGMLPERRLMLEAVYGAITLKNNIPIGYVLASSLFESTEVAYNIFDTYRGAEAGLVLGRLLSTMHHLFGCNAFSIDPYQLGYGNAEGLQSGAWWFYYKMGFRPQDPEVRRVLRTELARMKKNPRHRSDVDTLEQLASEYVFLHLDRKPRKVLGGLELGNVGLRIANYLSQRFGSNREAGLRACSREAAELLGVRSMRAFSLGERLAWERWSPLTLILPGVKRWSRQNKRELVRVIRAKGGRRESDFVRLFDRHRPLRRAVLKLCEDID